MAVIKNNGYALEQVSKELQSAIRSHFSSDKELVMVALANDESYDSGLFLSIDKKLQADKEVILASVKNNYPLLEFISDKLVDKEVILSTLDGDDWEEDSLYIIFQYVGDDAPCWKDKSLCLELINWAHSFSTMGPRLIGASHPSIWTDKTIVTAMLENLFDVAVEDYHYHAYGYTAPWTDCFDFDGFLEKLKNSPFIEDKEVMLQAWKLEYADAVETECEFGLKELMPEFLRKDLEFILEAIKWSSANALAFADKSLLSNKEIKKYL